jgi:uncharacterized protein
MVGLLLIVYVLVALVCFAIAAVGLTAGLVAVARRRRAGRPYALPLVLGLVACLPFLGVMVPVALLAAWPHLHDEHAAMGPLLAAIDRNEIESVRRQLRQGADANGVNASYQNLTPLYFAVEKRRHEIVALLIESRADVNLRAGRHGYPPLFAAIENDDRTALQYLLGHGADPNLRGLNATALMHAVFINRDPEIVRLLLDHGADVNLKYLHDMTPLHIVLHRDHWEGRADTFKERYEFATLLIERGADLAARDEDGKTALDYARERGYAEIAAYMARRATRGGTDGGR